MLGPKLRGILNCCLIFGYSAIFTPAAGFPNTVFEVAFDSLPGELRTRFHDLKPHTQPSRVLAKTSGSKVSHYKIESTGKDRQPASLTLPIKDFERLEIEWEDRNGDGKIDQQHLRWLGWADRDEVFRDIDFDGTFDEHTVFGAGIITSKIKMLVPRPLPSSSSAN